MFYPHSFYIPHQAFQRVKSSGLYTKYTVLMENVIFPLQFLKFKLQISCLQSPEGQQRKAMKRQTSTREYANLTNMQLDFEIKEVIYILYSFTLQIQAFVLLSGLFPFFILLKLESLTPTSNEHYFLFIEKRCLPIFGLIKYQLEKYFINFSGILFRLKLD